MPSSKGRKPRCLRNRGEDSGAGGEDVGEGGRPAVLRPECMSEPPAGAVVRGCTAAPQRF